MISDWDAIEKLEQRERDLASAIEWLEEEKENLLRAAEAGKLDRKAHEEFARMAELAERRASEIATELERLIAGYA